MGLALVLAGHPLLQSEGSVVLPRGKCRLGLSCVTGASQAAEQSVECSVLFVNLY